tara:strand:- start:317 stop:445 length:129 start_codon:yes stop_codon:yes gene_type:complete
VVEVVVDGLKQDIARVMSQVLKNQREEKVDLVEQYQVCLLLF